MSVFDDLGFPPDWPDWPYPPGAFRRGYANQQNQFYGLGMQQNRHNQQMTTQALADWYRQASIQSAPPRERHICDYCRTIMEWRDIDPAPRKCTSCGAPRRAFK